MGRGDDAATVSVVPPKDEATKELEDRLERCRADLARGRETQRRLERSLADAARRAADVEARQDAEDAALDAWAGLRCFRALAARTSAALLTSDGSSVSASFTSVTSPAARGKACAWGGARGEEPAPAPAPAPARA